MLNWLKDKETEELDSILDSAKEFVSNNNTKLYKIDTPENDEIIKYDNRGSIISDIVENSNHELEDIGSNSNTLEETIEFGILDFNKSSISTKKYWNIEDDKAGAFFIYNSTEDLSWSKIFLKDKETQEIIWISPLKDLPNQIKIDNCKSRVVYMSSKAIFTEDLQNTSGNYELFIGDNDDNSIDFNINDLRNNFEDIVVEYGENKSSYLINHILKYSNYEISRKDRSNISNKYDNYIIIEKIGDKYSVLLNKPKNVINKVFFLKDNVNSIYHNWNGSIYDILSTIEKTMSFRFLTTVEEFNDLNKLIIADETININEATNLDIVCRKDILENILNKDVVLIDKDTENTNIMLYDEQGKVLTISLEYLNNDAIEDICNILNYKKIVMTGIIQDVNESSLGNEESLSSMLVRND